MKQTTKVVRAIDAGYGLTKFIRKTDDTGQLICEHFPSLAVPSDPQTMRSLNIRHRDTVDVNVNGSSYEVGRDIIQAQTGNDVGREIGENWSQAPNYQAVMMGALHYMDVDKIDLLVLGLPVHQYLSEDRCNALSEKYTGKFELPNNRTVSISKVAVRPQPLGGYIDFGNHIGSLNKLIEEKCQHHIDKEKIDIGISPLKDPSDLFTKYCVLVVDPGEFTLDWLLIDQGAINTKASGAAADSGRHRIVRDVHRALQQDLGQSIAPASLTRINESLRTGCSLKLGGRIVDISKYDKVVAQSVADPISRLIEGLRGLEDRIDIILLIGGHPAIYKSELEKRFPYVPVFLPEDPLYANVRGFQRMGEALIANE